MHNRNTSTFTRGNIGVCHVLQALYIPQGIGVDLYDIDFRGNPLQSFIDVGSNASIDIVVITTSNNLQFLIDAARNHSEKIWVTFRSQTDFKDLLPRNLFYAEVPEFLFSYLKGILAASMSTSNQFAITIPNLNTTQWIAGANFYLAGLRSILPNAVLIGYNGKGRFGFNEVPVLQHIAANYPNISILCNQGSQAFYPAAIRSLNSSILLIESGIDVNSPDADKVAFSDPVVLSISEFNMAPYVIDLLNHILAHEPIERLTIRSKSEDDTPLLRLGNFSSLVPTTTQKSLRKLEKQYAFKTDDDFSPVLCNTDIVTVYKDITLVPNGQCLTYETALEGLILHPDIAFITLP